MREDNIKMDLKKLECEDVNWILLVQDRNQWWAFENTVKNFR